MAKFEGFLVAEVRSARTNELLANQLEQEGRDPHREVRARQIRDRADIEGLAHDRRAAENGALVRAEELEARSEQRVDPGRDGDVVEVAHGDPATVERLQLAIVDEHRDQLLDEERVALGATRDVIPNLREALRLAEQLGDQAVAGGIVQWLEPHDRAGAGACAVPPFREPLEQLGAAGAEQDDRDRLGMAREVLDQLEQRCLGPVRIVEEHDEGALGGEGREQPSDRPEALRDDAGRLLQAR